MTGHKGAYLAALVAAVVVLLGSMTAAAVYVTSHTGRPPSTTVGAVGQSGGWGGWGSGQNGRDGWNGMDGGMGGMMGDDGEGWMSGDGWTVTGGTGNPVTGDQARALAQDWVDTNTPGAGLDAGTAMAGAYRFTVTRDGQTVAWVWVESATGRLGVRVLADPSPSPAT